MSRWGWEHLALVWLLAAGAAVGTTLARFPPGRPLRPVWPPPSRVVRGDGPRALRLLVRREPLLATGWGAAPLAAAAVTAAWAVARRRGRGPAGMR